MEGVSPSGRAARAQNHGFAQVDALMRSLSADSETSMDPSTLPSSQDSTPASNAEREAHEREEDERAVDEELNKYAGEGLAQETPNFDLLKYWEVSFPAFYLAHMSSEHREKFREEIFPTLFQVALDILPVQASAVPSERAFSASKETDTDRRSNMDVELMEKLQVLKYAFRETRLSFTEDWVAPQPLTDTSHSDRAVDSPDLDSESDDSDAMFDRLFAEGDLSSLAQLMARDLDNPRHAVV